MEVLVNLRLICWTVLVMGAVYGVSTEATAGPRDFTPALCYLAAAHAIAKKNLADEILKFVNRPV